MVTKIIKKVGIATFIAGTACAAHATGAGGYFGFMLGQTNLNVQNQTITIQPTPPLPATTQTVNPSGKGMGFRLMAGYNMNQYAAIEGGYMYSYASSTYKTSLIDGSLQMRTNSVDFFAKGMLPIYDSGFGIFGKLGGTYITVKGSSAQFPTSSTSGFRPVVAVGASYDMTQNWVVDLSYTSVRYSTSQFKNPSFLALGISYHLLDPKCGQFLC